MNKYFIKAAFCAALAMPLFTACELDQFPESGLTTGDSWKNFERAKQHYVGLQVALRAVSGGSAVAVAEVQSDLFNATRNAVVYGQVYDWTFTTEQFDGDLVWGNNFAMVKQANEILTNMKQYALEEPKTERELQQTALSYKYLSASHFAIAYAYSNMIVRYCKDYEPETATKELGLPLLTPEMGVDAKPSRATLEETVQFIREHMKQAKDMMAEAQKYEKAAQAAGSAEFTIQPYGSTGEAGLDAYNALEARFNLYTHKFDEAIASAESLIAQYPLTIANAYPNLWLQDVGDEIIFQPLQTPDELVKSMAGVFINYDIRSSAAEGAYINGVNPYYIPTQGLLNLYEESDVRKQVFFGVSPYLGQELPLTYQTMSNPCKQFWKYPGNPNLMKDYQREWYSKIYNMVKAFRSSELYMIVAEASLKKSAPDEATARQYLNMLREVRGASPVSDAVSGADLVKVMEDEWTREFVGEGFRLDCLKRWHQGFTRMKAQEFSDALLRPGKGDELKIEADNMRFVWEIPSQDLQANSNLVPNWKSAK